MIEPNEYRPPYDLEDRTYEFALRVRLFLKQRIRERVDWSDVTRLLRSSGSVAANHLEAREAVSDNDFTHRVRISRIEVRESRLWLRLLNDTNNLNASGTAEFEALLAETAELACISTTIVRKRESSS